MELNQIYNEEALFFLTKLPSESIDLILTDPPYNLGKDFENENLSEEEYLKFITPIMMEFKRIIKPKHSIIIFFDNGKNLSYLWKAIFESGLYHQRTCMLYKPNDCSMPHNRTLRKSEAFLILSNTKELHHDGDKFMHDVVIANHEKKEEWYHPTAKNIDAIRFLIEVNTLKQEIVLDCFMGSGTTAVACKQTGRNFYGCELNKEYIKIAEDRLKQSRIERWF